MLGACPFPKCEVHIVGRALGWGLGATRDRVFPHWTGMKQEDTSEMPTAESCGCDTGHKLLGVAACMTQSQSSRKGWLNIQGE